MLKLLFGRARWIFGTIVGSVGVSSLIPSSGIIMGLLALAISVTGFGTALYFKIVSTADIYAAETTARSQEKAACEEQITSIQSQIVNDGVKKVADAAEAANSVSPLPETEKELIDLCISDSNCRNRAELKRKKK